MANLGNLIVRGVTRILGDAYANKFIGNLQGNADTATSAIKASTADSATNASFANKASIATAVQDYGTSDYREIKIGYNGIGLSSSTITHAVGFTDGGTKIKDISKDEFRNWLATASGTWNISISGNAATATNAENISSIYPQLAASLEADEINVKRQIDWNSWGDYGYKLEAAIDFNWYETHNLFGVIRGGNTDSAGFGWMYSSDGSTYTPIARLSPDGHLYLASSLTISGAISGVTDITASGHAKANSLKTQYICIECDNSGNTAGRSSEINNYAGPLYIQHNTSNNCFICSGGGNVLIGTTTNNGQKLQVSGSILADLGNNGGVLIGNKGNTIDGYANGTLTDLHFNYTSSGKLTMCNGGGNVGIGTVSPFSKLHVVGDIYTTTGFKKEGSSDSYVLLGGGGHKLVSAFSMVHDHPYLPLSGGTLTGSVMMSGIDTNLIRNIVCDGTSGWARDLIALQVDGVRKFSVGAYGNYTAGASNNGIYYGYIGCNDYDGLNLRISDTSLTWGDNPILHSGNYNSYVPTLTGTGATGTWEISITGNAKTATNASAVNGVSLTWGGEITSSQWIAAWESGNSIRAMSVYDTFISMCSYLDEGSSDVTDGTMFITSYATDNGFDDPNDKNKPYKRKASFLWNYINNKCSSIYATQSWVNDNFYTYSESDNRYIQSETDPIWNADKVNYYTKTECNNRYIQSETDPVWTAAKGNYYTKTECNNKFQPKGTYLTEQNLQGYATQEWVRGEEYLYRSGGTMDARAEIGITTKLFIGNSTSPDTCYTKFNCILHGGGDESNPNWVIRDNGYSEFKSSVSANAFYVSSDIRLKNILDDINIDFDKLKLIPKKYYTWKGSDILQLGTIAQDIQKIYPEVVSKNENGYLSVDYSKLSIIALAAIDKLNERIKELECQIKL